MTTTHHYSYQDARAKFLMLTKGAERVTHVHPLSGPDGEIAMDIAMFGDPAATRALVLSSGTHGVEGYCGSFIQCQLLSDDWHRNLPKGFMLVLIHGVNPYGFAWQRRVNEDNIDLNRNFIGHDDHPVNEGYRELAAVLAPEEWSDQSMTKIWESIEEISAQHAEPLEWRSAAMTGGQYQFPNGLFYGGEQPAWSNQKLRNFADEYLTDRAVAWLDIHTALGKFGAAECIVEYEPGSPSLEAAEALWGDRVRNTKTKESLSTDIKGSISFGMHEHLGNNLVIAGLEYGTVKSSQVVGALIADQWLHRHGDLDSEQGKKIKQQMMDAFYPDDAEWRRVIYKTATDLIAPMFGR